MHPGTVLDTRFFDRRIHRDVIVYIFSLAYELIHRRCSLVDQLGAKIKRAG